MFDRIPSHSAIALKCTKHVIPGCVLRPCQPDLNADLTQGGSVEVTVSFETREQDVQQYVLY